MKASHQAVGLPPHAMNLIDALYDNNYCNIAYQGGIYEGFSMECGVRQGCPISPLLFAAAVDALLRILDKRIQEGTFKAFADDIGAVIEDWDRDGPIAEGIFRDFALMSGLELNIEKTVAIPLWDEPIEDIQAELRNSERPWQGICIASAGTYLGFVVGPGREQKVWDKPTKKFRHRANCWGGLGTGLMFTTLAYNTFAFSTLGFIAQLAIPPPSIFLQEVAALRSVLPGPGHWIEPRDAFALKESFGQLHSFKSLQGMAVAAKLRVKFTHDQLGNGPEASRPALSIRTMAYNLRQLCVDNIRRAQKWNSWYQSAFAKVLDDNERGFSQQCNLSVEDIRASIAGPRPWNTRAEEKQRKCLQKTAYKYYMESIRENGCNRLREKLTRWTECKGNAIGSGIPGNIGEVAPRIHRNLMTLHKFLPPRMCAAVLRLLFNGWSTHRRFQNRGLDTNRCMLGCPGEAEDSIEHYCRCPAVKHIQMTKLRVDVSSELALSFWSLNMCGDEDSLTAAAMSIYATYMATNHYRHSRRASSTERAQDAMKQYLIQGCFGYPKVGKFLRHRWKSPMLRVA